MNSAPRSFFCSLIAAISYKELLHTPVMEYVIVGVVEVDAQLFSQQYAPAVSQTHLCMILCVPTSVLRILAEIIFLFTRCYVAIS